MNEATLVSEELVLHEIYRHPGSPKTEHIEKVYRTNDGYTITVHTHTGTIVLGTDGIDMAKAKATADSGVLAFGRESVTVEGHDKLLISDFAVPDVDLYTPEDTALLHEAMALVGVVPHVPVPVPDPVLASRSGAKRSSKKRRK